MTCRKQGLELARIDSEAENEQAVRVMNIVQKGTFAPALFDGANWFWIGASDVLLEGRFLWEDGTPCNYTNWGKGQPDNAHPLRGGESGGLSSKQETVAWVLICSKMLYRKTFDL